MSKRIDLTEAAKFLKERDDILIISHANPDGDTLGCAFGLCRALQNMGKRAVNVCADKISPRYDFMKEAVREMQFEPMTFVSVDVADRTLFGDFEKLYADKIDLAIDHHITHVDFAKLICVEPEAAACAQTVYKILREMDAPIDDQTAACLYTGISTDSGCFKYSSVSPETHLIAAELIKYDFDFAKLNYIFFDMKTPARIKLEEEIYRDIEYYCGGKCALVSLTKAQLDSVDPEDTNGISAIPRMIGGVEIGVVMKEKSGAWKASLRSNSSADVQDICTTFGGGGHHKAAGCTFRNMSLEEAKKLLIARIEQVLS